MGASNQNGTRVQYVVIENTPGYMPEDDEPFVTEDLAGAREYLKERVESYVDSLCEGYGYPDAGVYEPVVWWAEDLTAAEVTDPERIHDLGRCFSINVWEES